MNSERAERVLVFLPSFNDCELLGRLTRSISELGTRFIPLVIDDGSQQPVQREALAPRTRLVRLPTNFGIGVATHVAFDHALKQSYAAIVRVDADGQHPVTAIVDLVASIKSGDADIVVGVRTNRNSGSGWRAGAAELVRNYLAAVSRWMSGGRAPSDVNSGFFAAGSNAIRVLNAIDLDRFPEPQMYMLAARRGLRIREIPIEQAAREYGRSTITLGHALRIFYAFNIMVLAELLQRSKVR
jgi:glycosyltransferase involved in cell wall biosynthesis